MATKKSSSKTKTAKKPTATKSVKKPVARKTVHATEPYHPSFGIVVVIVCALIAAVLLLAATKSIALRLSSDAVRFADEYTYVEEDNLFKIKTATETIDILEHGTGVVFIGFPECQWCQTYAPMLNSLAKTYGLEEIFYYNVRSDREANTEAYQKIVSLLSDRLQYDNAGQKRIYVPETVFVVEGKIIGNDHETSKDTLGLKAPKEYWTDERIAAWQEKLRPLFAQLTKSTNCATTCNE